MRNNTLYIAMVCLLLLASALFSVSVTAQQQNAAPSEAAADTVAVADSTEYVRPEFEYNSAGRRDPFNSLAPVTDVEQQEKTLKGLFNYEKASLNGIVKSGEDYYALVTDEHGYSYVLRRGYKVFGGYVTDITEDAIKLHLVKYGRSMKIIFRLDDSRTMVEEFVGPDEKQLKKPGIDIRYTEPEKRDDGPTITVEDIALPSLNARTVDDVWFRSGSPAMKDAEPVDEVAAVKTFSLIAPPNGAVIELPYEMNWTDCEGEAITYTIVFDDSNDFSSPEFMKGGLEQSAYVLAAEDGLPTGKMLFWKVTAHDEDGARFESRQGLMPFMIR